MVFQVGDLVTRISYNHDVVFKILNIRGEVAYLKGVQVRLYADAPLEDLQLYVKEDRDEEDDEFLLDDSSMRGDFFYLPGKVFRKMFKIL